VINRRCTAVLGGGLSLPDSLLKYGFVNDSKCFPAHKINCEAGLQFLLIQFPPLLSLSDRRPDLESESKFIPIGFAF
jgi:hypothetical protein